MATMNDFAPEFLFGDDAFLSAEPMTDAEFAAYVVIENDEIPIETVDFSDSILD